MISLSAFHDAMSGRNLISGNGGKEPSFLYNEIYVQFSFEAHAETMSDQKRGRRVPMMSPLTSTPLMNETSGENRKKIRNLDSSIKSIVFPTRKKRTDLTYHRLKQGVAHSRLILEQS